MNIQVPQHCTTPKALISTSNSSSSATTTTATTTSTNNSTNSISNHKRSSKDELLLLNSNDHRLHYNSTNDCHLSTATTTTTTTTAATRATGTTTRTSAVPTVAFVTKPTFTAVQRSCRISSSTTSTNSTTTTNQPTFSPRATKKFNRYPMTKQLSTTTAPGGQVNATGGGGGGGAAASATALANGHIANGTTQASAVVNTSTSAIGSSIVGNFAAQFLHVNNLTPTIISPTASLSPTTTTTLTSNLVSPSSQVAKTAKSTTTGITGTIPKKCLTPQASITSLGSYSSSAASSHHSPTAIATNQTSSMMMMNSLAPATTIKKPLTAPALTAKKSSSSSSSSNDANGRSAALERAYVHDVYEHCDEPTGSLRPRVAQFLSNLEAGSVVCDVGCGSGRYLTQCNPSICTVGVDRCYRLSRVAKEKGGEVALCDNLELPFRDESFDAVLSIAVVHHFATTERRVNALRELARILRIGGRVVITVWALEQRHRRFESQDVLIPWQQPKNRNFNYSDEEDDDDFLPPYHAYTEDSTNSSRSAGDGDSSSLSSSSPGESCYSFVRRAIQKLAGGRKHAWFLESWTSKDTKNDSSLDYEDAKDLPIELRRLEDFEDFTDPPLSAGLKSRSLGSILNPPPRQIVRSRSSVPSLGGPLINVDIPSVNANTSVNNHNNNSTRHSQFLDAPHHNYNASSSTTASGAAGHSTGHSPTHHATMQPGPTSSSNTIMSSSSLSRRPKLIKQKQSLCDEDYQLPDTPFHMMSSYNMTTNGVTSGLYTRASSLTSHNQQSTRQMRKQSSLNEELMAGNRIREKERVRKRIQKQMSLNEAFLCRSALFSKRLQVIREGVTSKIKSSTGSLERVTKTGITKIMQNLKTSTEEKVATTTTGPNTVKTSKAAMCTHEHHHHHHHYYQQQQQQQPPQPSPLISNFQTHLQYLLHRQNTAPAAPNKFSGPVTICKSLECATTACYCQTYHQGCTQCNAESSEEKARRHSRESGSDSSKDSSLQSDTSIESEDSFASVIFIPKPEQHQQQLNYQKQHHNSNSSSSNSSSSNGGSGGGGGGGCHMHKTCCQSRCVASTSANALGQCCKLDMNGHRISSVPTSPLIMPCPPTPAHSPAAAQTLVTSPPQSVPAVVAAMAMLTPPLRNSISLEQSGSIEDRLLPNGLSKTRFNFDEAHIKQQETKDMLQQQQKKEQPAQQNKPLEKPKPKDVIEQIKADLMKKSLASNTIEPRITRQTIKDLPPIPKFRKQQSLQISRQNFPIVRRTITAGGPAIAAIPRLMSLELFNPATDDLDSDSSEPSSPDSVDSVISAPRSNALTTAPSLDQTKDLSPAPTEKETQEQEKKPKSLSSTQDIILNDDAGDIVPNKFGGQQSNPPEDCAEFAEKLSAQLMRELEEKNQINKAETRSLDGMASDELFEDPFTAPLNRKRNGEKDLAALRDELRERRLMLANLSTQASLNQSPNSSSTSSLSSQTRSFTIHEEDEDEDEEEHERSYTQQLYENCKISKLNYKRHLQSNNLHPETTYLLQDEDSSMKDEEDEAEYEEIEHDVIPEEDEDDEEEASQDNDRSSSKTKDTITLKCDSSLDDKEDETKKSSGEETTTLQNRNQSTESWEHSNSSTTSLDSPSQGGATTHHRYYHVFREGELDALINHHVASLHIVSSYYERASWCVVAEKVQVWTI